MASPDDENHPLTQAEKSLVQLNEQQAADVRALWRHTDARVISGLVAAAGVVTTMVGALSAICTAVQTQSMAPSPAVTVTVLGLVVWKAAGSLGTAFKDLNGDVCKRIENRHESIREADAAIERLQSGRAAGYAA
jgi:hypothetical protein